MVAKCLLAVLMFFLSWAGESAQPGHSFTIELYPQKARVISPRRYHPRTHLIIQNKTLTSIMGRVENMAGQVKKYVSIRSGKTRSFPLGEAAQETLFFVPLSPPFHAFELKVGNPRYEIPPQR